MSAVLSLNKSNCKDCYKCIRNCPVKAISFAEDHAQIISTDCILCGKCFVVCPQNAKEVRSDVSAVREAIRAGKTVCASVAPSFITDFDVSSISNLATALRALGFSIVEETAVGAEIVSHEYDRMMEKGEQSIIISSCCASINSLILKYHPMMKNSLAHVLSPMQAHCKLMREQHSNAFTVFVGPCISKKGEADESEYTDAAITFDELRQWLENEKITITREPDDEEEGKRARLYPSTGGILRTLHPSNGYHTMAVDGVENCQEVLRELEAGKLQKVFIEMSACEGGCINGPSIRDHRQTRVSSVLAMENYAGDGEFGVDMPGKVNCRFPDKALRKVMPGSAAIQDVLNQMGKTSPDKELNCGCCGYPTCRDKAIAVCQGRAEIGMCLPFLKAKAETFSEQILSSTPNSIMVLNEDLIVQQVNDAAIKMFKLTGADDIVGAPIVRLLDPSDYMNVVLSGKNVINKCHYIAEYKLFVEESIVYDKQYRILVSVMRDVTEREHSRAQEQEIRKQTLEITNNVINKQMTVVQEIASLLGETTAETKIALTKLKDAMKNE